MSELGYTEKELDYIVKVEVVISGIDSGEIGYSINVYGLDRLMKKPQGKKYAEEIKHQLNLLLDKVDEYLIEAQNE